MMQNMLITGLGVISAAGKNLQENWQWMLGGRSAIAPLTQMQTPGLTTDMAGQIADSNEALLASLARFPGSHAKLPLERGEILLYKAFEEAIADAGICIEKLSQKRVGLLLGTSLCGFTNLENEFVEKARGRRKFLSLASYFTYPLNTVIDRLAFDFNLNGPRFLFSTACSASLHPVIAAEHLMRTGRIDLAIIGGTDPISRISLAGFSLLKSLAKQQCAPFSETDYGILIGEGAAVLILETETALKARDSWRSYAAIVGSDGTSDAYHPTASNPTAESIRRCIANAVASIKNNDDFEGAAIMAHGTGTAHNDRVEARALANIDLLKSGRVSALKSIIGHTLGASGAIELAMLAYSLRAGRLLPIANFSTPRQGCDISLVTTSESSDGAMIGIKNAFAFGGNNVCVAISNNPHIEMLAETASTDAPEGDSIAVSGIGIVSAYDIYDLQALRQAMLEGATAIKQIPAVESFNGRPWLGAHAAVIDENKLHRFCVERRIKTYRKMDKISRMACAAASSALADAGYKVTSSNTYETGLVATTGTGPLASVGQFYTDIINKGVRSTDANVFPNTVVNAHAGYASLELRIKGYTTVIAQGASSFFAGMTLAANLLTSGRCRAVLLGATSEYSTFYHKALLDIRHVNRHGIQKIYDEESCGNIPGEASVFLVLERASHAAQRGAAPYCFVERIGLEMLPAFPTAFLSDPNPLEVLFKRDIKSIPQPDIIFGDGNGLRQPGRMEAQAVAACFSEIPLAATSEYFGYAPCASTALNLAAFSIFQGQCELPTVLNTTRPVSNNLLVTGTTPQRMMNALISGLFQGGCAGYIHLRACEGRHP